MTPALLANVLGDTVAWFGDGEHWRGSAGIPTRLVEHLLLSGSSLLLAAIVSLPLGAWLGHRRRGGLAVVSAANIARAVPSFGLIVLGVVIVGIGAAPVVVALVVLAVPPMLVNAYTGVRGVDPDLVDAARGLGLSSFQVLRKVEVPAALGLLMTGVRTAASLVVATATLAAVVPGIGGLGPYVVDGIGQQDTPKALAGATLVAGLGLLTELGFALLQRAVVPVGVRQRR